jgi:hypothetical protein
MKKTTFQLHDICAILAVDEFTIRTTLERVNMHPIEVTIRSSNRQYVRRYWSKEQLEIIKTMKI